MKKILVKTLIISVVVLLIPFVLTTFLNTTHSKLKSDLHKDINITYLSNGIETELTFHEYLIGVVAANMPAGYHMEALKAQAVIARTYALYNISYLQDNEGYAHDFTTSELGLSYISLEELKKYWNDEEYISQFTKIENAVYSTEDQVLVYDNAYILPVFFDSGSGMTRDASEAWGVSIPYLKSVSSKHDVTSSHYLKITEFEVSDFIRLLSGALSNVALTEETIFEDVIVTERDGSGYVLTVQVKDQTLTGDEFSKAMSLNSSHFYIENYEGYVRIICNGVGHGVGLSQYGANVMAEAGNTYDQILSQYYLDTQLIQLEDYKK